MTLYILDIQDSRGLRSRARFERDETRLELIARIGGTGTRLMFSGLLTQEKSGFRTDIVIIGLTLTFHY